jgi:hypothetical protein
MAMKIIDIQKALADHAFRPEAFRNVGQTNCSCHEKLFSQDWSGF